MPKEKAIGTCDKCGAEILSAMDRKDHTLGAQKRITPENYRSGMYVGVA